MIAGDRRTARPGGNHARQETDRLYYAPVPRRYGAASGLRPRPGFRSRRRSARAAGETRTADSRRLHRHPQTAREGEERLKTRFLFAKACRFSSFRRTPESSLELSQSWTPTFVGVTR